MSMRSTLHRLLASLARAVIRRQRPRMIGVTGSVGKTSTREAIRAVVSAVARTRSAEKNYNNEIGLPVTIIGTPAPGSSAAAWIRTCARGAFLAAFRARSYPETLVLEYGADHPGDLAYLTRIAKPAIAVVTAVGPAHTEFFGSVERVIAEKRRLVAVLPSDGTAVLNRDDANVYAMRDRTPARVWTYGFHAEADVRGIEYQVTYGDGNQPAMTHASGESARHDSRVGGIRDQATIAPTGIAFKVVVGGSTVPVHLAGCIGEGHASAALAAVAVGVSLGMHLVDISHALARYAPPPGRMRILGGVKRTTIMDDTYNASPLAVALALTTLASFPGRRIAVLGDMLELGARTEHEHEHIGELVAAGGVTRLVTVGEASRALARGTRAAGMPHDAVVEFGDAAAAGRYVQDMLEPGDVVLVKGSQGMRMERIVKEIMNDPLRASALLCRQDAKWLTRE